LRQGLEFRRELGGDLDPDPREAGEQRDRAATAVLEVGRDVLCEEILEELRLRLDALPVRPTLEFADPLQAIRRPGWGDAEPVEALDLFLEVLQDRLGGLALTFQRLGLFLEDPGQPGGGERTDAAGTGRTLHLHYAARSRHMTPGRPDARFMPGLPYYSSFVR
jgi:hypothetical protein